MKKLTALAVLLLSSFGAQAALIEMYDVNRGIGNVNQAEAIIAGATGPTLSWNTSTVNYHNNWPNGRRNTFVAHVTGTLDTDLYSTLTVRHDDGFRLRLNGVVVGQYVGLTAPRNTTFSFASAGVQSFDLVYFENRGTETLRVRSGNRLAQIGDPAAVPEPGALAMLGLGLAGLGLRKKKAA